MCVVPSQTLRLSFPSGHSSLTVYAAVFLMVCNFSYWLIDYSQYRMGHLPLSGDVFSNWLCIKSSMLYLIHNLLDLPARKNDAKELRAGQILASFYFFHDGLLHMSEQVRMGGLPTHAAIPLRPLTCIPLAVVLICVYIELVTTSIIGVTFCSVRLWAPSSLI